MNEPTTFGGLRLRNDFQDKEPRIRDLELAKRLGYDRPRDIRKIVERLHNDGLLSKIEFCATAAQNPEGRGRPGTEYWLDERSALFVIARSETPAASAILGEVIDVFMAYRRGTLMPRLLADAPCEWALMWPKSLVAALCHLYGQPYDGRSPRFLASVNARLYRLVLEPKVYAEMKERNPDPKYGSNHHQWLTEQARTKFAQHLSMIEGTALLSSSTDEFWARLESCYLDRPLQLPLMGV